MLIAPYYDLAAVEALLNEHNDIAAIIAEPLQRIIPAAPGYLQGLRDLCNKYAVLLIFDEIVTGFRLAYGGAPERYGVTPDICTLGNIIGGGFPLAALGASAEIMQHFDKSIVGADKWLMQLGTLSGNPVAAAASPKTMEVLRRDGSYDRLRAIGKSLQDMQSDALTQAGVPHHVCGDETNGNALAAHRLPPVSILQRPQIPSLCKSRAPACPRFLTTSYQPLAHT